MAFLTPSDLNTHIYDEVVEAISEGDTSILQAAIDAAVAEATLYMSRFDIDGVFALVPKDPILLLWMKDIAKWHFIPLANPNVDLEIAEKRYNMAIKSLQKIQDSKAVPKGWPLIAAPNDEQSQQTHVRSNTKRGMYR